MKSIIHGVGALLTWTIIPSMRVHFLVVYYPVEEAILIVIPMGGHLGYYPSMGEQQKYCRVSRGLKNT
jgi:hypothetical protein